jgi:hypothetical protein
MIDPAESSEKATPQPSAFTSSPYAPPSIIDERIVVADSFPRRLPVVLSFIHAMAVVTGLLISLQLVPLQSLQLVPPTF